MPSPNGYLTGMSTTAATRGWFRLALDYDLNQPPWPPGGAANFHFTINTGTSATGPFTLADLTGPTECSASVANPRGVGGAASTVTGVGAPTGGAGTLTPGTSYWVEVVVDNGGTEVDRWVQGPFTTDAYAVFTPVNQSVTATTADVLLGSTGDPLELTAPCDVDKVTWQVSTTPGGPYTNTTEDATSMSPSHTFTGLTPDTQYYWRASVADNQGVTYWTGPELTFRTAMTTPPPFNPQPCCGDAAGASCGQILQFCQTGTTTGPVEHPGRMYDFNLPVNPGFDFTSLTVDSTNYAAGIVWDVADPDGAQFATDVKNFIQGRIAGSTVTVTNPNAGQTNCGLGQPFHVHIECLRLDKNPPNLVEAVYNGGQDLIQNPAYNENPPLNPPVAQGNYGYHLLARQDDPGPFPGNPPSGRALCTNTANRGWETNDSGRTFEIWGQDVATGVTPTPRGTPVQEITSDGPPPGKRSTIWQTFTAPASGNFIIHIVHGGRDAGEQHKITLDNGDTNDSQLGTLINNVTTPQAVYGGNPWTQFDQTIPLNSGSTYTLALSTNNPVGGARGGLFTDMRAYIDRPGLRATAVNNDDTCVVTTQETTTTETCSFWQVQCTGGDVTGWKRVDTGVTLTNAEFWAQVPTPGCCTGTAAQTNGGSSTLSNMAVSDVVCGVVGGVPTNLIRQVVMDPSGGVTSQQFLTTNGAPVTPTSWQAGACASARFANDVRLCDQIPNSGTVSFLRKYIQSVDSAGNGQVNSFRDFDYTGAEYTVQGTVVDCADVSADRETVCWTDSNSTPGIHTGTIRHQDGINAQGWILFDQNRTLVGDTSGVTFVPCEADPFSTTGLCLGDGTPISVVTRWNHATATYVDDGWINLLTGTFSPGAPPAGTRSCGTPLNIQTSDVLCDITPADNVVHGLVLIQYHYNPDGSIASTDVVSATTGAPYTPVGQVTVCPTDTGRPDNDMQVLCDRQADGSLVSFVRDYQRSAVGQINGFSDYTLAGAAYTVTGTVQSCIPRVSEIEILCDGTGVKFVRSYTFAGNGTIASFADTTLAGAPFTPAAPVGACPGDTDSESVILCDSATTPNRFVRTYQYSASGTISGFTDTTLAGAPFTPTGAVQVCPTATTDAESFILCDSASPTPNRFVRTYTYTATGAVAGFTDATLAGGAFVPTGAVGVCATTVQSDTDFVEEVLCDSNGTAFIRLFRFNSATGALISTTNTTLAGAAFTPVGTVGLCANCCPQVVGEGCTNTGSGHYTAIRATNGTITLIDSVSGATVTSGQIVGCPAATVSPSSVTLTAQGRLIADADAAWTPGTDVVGTLTSVTMTILSGTANVVDQSGTTLNGLPAGYTATWAAEDHSTLSGPQSIDAIGGNTVVIWTQK